MKILYIWDADYPWDVRVEKISGTLYANGHEIYIAARNLKRFPEVETINGLNIRRMKAWRNHKVNYFLSFPVFFSPIWRRFLDQIIKTEGIELIIVRDLPLAIAGLLAGKRNGIPVIFDMAEDYVSMIWNGWKYGKFKMINLIVRNPYLAGIVEKYAIKKFDHILVVVDEAREVVHRAGGDLNKVTIVSNTPSLENFRNRDVQMTDDFRLLASRFSAIYIGGIQSGRGIQTVLDAIPKIIDKVKDFLFVVIGDGYAKNQLRKMIEDRNLQAHVLWIGWIDHKKIFDYIRVSKVGLVPHLVTDHVNTTIPNKLFDYMGCGVPVIGSDAAPIKRIMNEEKCGITFRSGNANDLAQAILKIYSGDFDYGKNGIDAVRRKYNWEKDADEILKVVKMFC